MADHMDNLLTHYCINLALCDCFSTLVEAVPSAIYLEIPVHSPVAQKIPRFTNAATIIKIPWLYIRPFINVMST